MANTQAMCTSFKTELLTATHNFGTAPTRGTGTADTFYGALYLASATLNASTTAYTTTGEVSGPGYSAGGIAVTNATPRLLRAPPLTGPRPQAWCTPA